MTTIPAAGTLPWRLADGALQVALVHRPRYDDWSWAKGKLDPGEEPSVAAVRETFEETGLVVRLGVPLPGARYTLIGKNGRPDEKTVAYWAARVTGGDGRLVHEIDDVAWLEPRAAHDRLDYARDRDQLLALVRRHQAGTLDTWPLVLVRHAHAVSRSDWDGDDDTCRPLDRGGQARAKALSPVLVAYGIRRVVSSLSDRCVQTVAPYVRSSDARLRTKRGLSEEGFEADPTRAVARLDKVLATGHPAAVCSHGPLMPTLVDVLLQHARDAERADRKALSAAAQDKLDKGEALVCHVSGTGARARVVAVERHRP